MTLTVVSAPPQFVDVFAAMESRIKAFFSEITMMPERGMMEISGVRFRYSQSEGLATAFRQTLTDTYGERGAEQILYQLGKSLGAVEGSTFHERFGLVDPIEKLAAGPVYFAYSGWAFVEILPSSAPQPNEDYILTYNHPNSFEADAYLNTGRRLDKRRLFGGVVFVQLRCSPRGPGGKLHGDGGCLLHVHHDPPQQDHRAGGPVPGAPHDKTTRGGYHRGPPVGGAPVAAADRTADAGTSGLRVF